MKQRIHIGIGCACLFVGWLGSFILNSLASGYEVYVLAPTLMIAFGLGLIWRTRGGKIAALSLAFTALLAVLTMNQLYPERALSIPAIKKTLSKDCRGRASYSCFSTMSLYVPKPTNRIATCLCTLILRSPCMRNCQGLLLIWCLLTLGKCLSVSQILALFIF